MFLISHWSTLKRNRAYKDRHKDQRVFILCNGPSVLQQNLLPLRNEIVMSVSSGYLHKNFSTIAPMYHFVPSVTYGLMQQADYIRWFEEMHNRLGRAELFLCSSEFKLVEAHDLFKGRCVNYLCAARPLWPAGSRILDISGLVPSFQSVPIMCLIVALYMGFQDIYLLGTEHDSFATGRYKYSFEPTVLRGRDAGVKEDGSIRGPLYDELRANLLLWTQYRHVKAIALANGRRIHNATVGGMLDEFPRIDLDRVLKPDAASRSAGLQ